MFVDEATWHFIDEHLQEDVRQLALQKNKYKDIDFDFALRQIQGRKKTRDKLPLLASIPRFVFPPSLALEQCSSEITAKYKRIIINDILCRDTACRVSIENDTDKSSRNTACRVSTGNHRIMADLTGGFGIDTLFLSNLFETCHYVEPQRQLCDILSHNLKLLQFEHVQIHQTTMEDFIQDMEPVDFLYLDPSRRNAQGSRVVSLEDCTPNIVQYKDILLQKARKVMLKLSPMLDIKRALAQLPETKEIYVLALNGECKELLLLLDVGVQKPLQYHAVNIWLEGNSMKELCFDFTDEEEQNAIPKFDSQVGQYLYEPNAAILKAGAFKSLATHFGLNKLHPHTHLYTSDSLIKEFPGRIFRVQNIYSYKDAKTALKTIQKANVAVRNFPQTADELKKSLKLADGGTVYVFGTTLDNGQKVIISCFKEKVKLS
ncbi:MAG: SAM-dependent methyltransferase [Bacteroidales bacterium]|nr:SAM-dependent methyltransferase [Bacteroidales bacterium]